MQEKSANFKQCKVWKLHFKWESWSNLPWIISLKKRTFRISFLRSNRFVRLLIDISMDRGVLTFFQKDETGSWWHDLPSSHPSRIIWLFYGSWETWTRIWHFLLWKTKRNWMETLRNYVIKSERRKLERTNHSILMSSEHEWSCLNFLWCIAVNGQISMISETCLIIKLIICKLYQILGEKSYQELHILV